MRELAPCPRTPNCISSQATQSSQRIEPLLFNGPASRAMQGLHTVLETTPQARIIESDPLYIHAVFNSRVFGFVDDLELLLVEPEGIIHVRSASRVGHWDLGANRRRVETLRRQFDALKVED